MSPVQRAGEVALVLLGPPDNPLASALVAASLALDAAEAVARGGEHAALRREVLAAILRQRDILHPKAVSAIEGFGWRAWVHEREGMVRLPALNLPTGEFRSALRTVLRREPMLLAGPDARTDSESRRLDLATRAIFEPEERDGRSHSAGAFVSRAADFFDTAARLAPPEQSNELRAVAEALRTGGPGRAREAMERMPDARYPTGIAADGTVSVLDADRTAAFGDGGPRTVRAAVAKGGPAGSAGLGWNLLDSQHALVHAALAREFPGSREDRSAHAVRHGEAATTAMWIARARAGHTPGPQRELDACRLLAESGRRDDTHPEVVAEAAAALVRDWFAARVPGGPRLVEVFHDRGVLEMSNHDALAVPCVPDAARFLAAAGSLRGADIAGAPGEEPVPRALRERLLLAGVPDMIAWIPAARDLVSLLVP